MIDTVRFRIFADEYNMKIFESVSCSILTLTPDGRELRKFNKFIAYDDITSQFEHIYMQNFGDYIYFEFSLHKFINRKRIGINYNHNNNSMAVDYAYFCLFVKMLNEFGFDIKFKNIELMRVDVGWNYRLAGLEVLDFFEILYLQMGKIAKIRSNHFQSSVYYPSRWVTKKLYSKYYDLKSLCSKGRLDRSNKKIKDLFLEIKDIVRLEFSLKKEKLKHLGVAKFNYDMLQKTKKYFEGEAMQILKFQEHFKKKEEQNTFTLQEQFFIKRVLEVGYKYAKEELINQQSRRTFFRVQKKLKDKGINLKSLTKEQIDEENIDVDSSLPEIKLTPIPCS